MFLGTEFRISFKSISLFLGIIFTPGFGLRHEKFPGYPAILTPLRQRFQKLLKSLKARQSVALQGMEAGRGAFGLLSLSSLALTLAAGAAAIFLLRLFEMSDPITLTLQSC